MKRLVLIFFLLLTACGGSEGAQPAAQAGKTPPALEITSPAFQPGASIPQKYTCQGEDLSPALEWSAPPAGTKSLALIMDDPDAPGGTWVHWVVYNLPPSARGLPESASQAAGKVSLPEGALQGKNSFSRVNYGGPCPPSGEHHYRFHLYALDDALSGDSLNKEALLKAMDGHILAQGEMVGLYKKQ
jgi:Raf kinase inhibitor-like YbhB/YbcL family protein